MFHIATYMEELINTIGSTKFLFKNHGAQERVPPKCVLVVTRRYHQRY